MAVGAYSGKTLDDTRAELNKDIAEAEAQGISLYELYSSIVAEEKDAQAAVLEASGVVEADEVNEDTQAQTEEEAVLEVAAVNEDDAEAADTETEAADIAVAEEEEVAEAEKVEETEAMEGTEVTEKDEKAEATADTDADTEDNDVTAADEETVAPAAVAEETVEVVSAESRRRCVVLTWTAEEAEEEDLHVEDVLDEDEDAEYSLNSTESVKISSGGKIYYKTYGWANSQSYAGVSGGMFTNKYTAAVKNYGTYTAYCLQPPVESPATGGSYVSRTMAAANANMTKILYYSSTASGSYNYFKTAAGKKFNSKQQYILTHIALAYAYGNGGKYGGVDYTKSGWKYGANKTAINAATALYKYATGQSVPKTTISLSSTTAKATISDGVKKSPTITLKGDSMQSATFSSLPSGVKVYNASTNKAVSSLKCGESFYITAPMSRNADV